MVQKIIIEEISKGLDVSQEKSQKYFDAVIDSAKRMLKENEELYFEGIGFFEVKNSSIIFNEDKNLLQKLDEI